MERGSRSSRKENKEPMKEPSGQAQLRSPLQPANGHRGKIGMAKTVKSLPTERKTASDIDRPSLVTWYVLLCLHRTMKVECGKIKLCITSLYSAAMPVSS